MLLYFSKRFSTQVRGIVLNNYRQIIWFVLIATLAFVLYQILGWKRIALPIAPVSIMGVAIAIFLGFRNSSAYDRWWEARKIWGGIVNTSRSWAMEVTSFLETKDAAPEMEAHKKELIYRHIAWMHSLALHLRKQLDPEEIKPFLNDAEFQKITEFKNVPAQLLNLQSKHLQQLYREDHIEDFSRIELNGVLKELYNLQGKAERIKNTVFPYYYNYFTRLFLWLFLLILPFALVENMGAALIPLSVAISFVFHILDKAGAVTEEPFEGRAADTPMLTLCRSIEIDMRQILGETDLPAPRPIQFTKYKAAFID